MSYKKKSWREKLEDNKGLPRILVIDRKQSKRWGPGTCVIPAPLEVDALMRRVRRGKLTTIDELRKALARKHGTTIACPITTGIFAWIAAHASIDESSMRRKKPTPYWRTLKSGGLLNPKYPGGITNLKRLLIAEGNTIVRRGRNFVVVDFDQRLAKL